MCFECQKLTFNRRNLLKFAAAGAASMALTAPRAFASGNESALTPDEALAKRQQGNAKFVADAEACATHLAERRSELVKGQAPWATILTCSDSRVTPELIFGGVNLGELFVIRNAGNVLETSGLGTMEYGAEHLHCPLIVVMGHNKCGAVAAACEVATKGTVLDGSIAKMILPIVPLAIANNAKSGDLVDKTVRANAVHGAEAAVAESQIISHLVSEGKVKVVPAYYDLDTGHVDFLTVG